MHDDLDGMFDEFDRQHRLFSDKMRSVKNRLIEHDLRRYSRQLDAKLDALIAPLKVIRAKDAI